MIASILSTERVAEAKKIFKAPSDSTQSCSPRYYTEVRRENDADMMAVSSDITLYTDSTPNGIKISIALEELGIPYETQHIDISTNRQKEPWYLEINPNGRIPAIVDNFEDGKSIRLFEGGSILQYLAEQYDPEHKISFKQGSREHFECNNWLFFQHGGKYSYG